MLRRRHVKPPPLALALLLAIASPAVADGPDPTYLPELVRRAADLKLAERREWRLLLHDRENLLGGWTSEVDDPGFFLSPDGKTDPEAELEATLAGFFSAEPVGRSKQPPQCAFIARREWLRAELQFDARRLPPDPCERFDAWYREINPTSLTLIFAAAYLNNPSSMFGHTFLRVDQRGQTEQTRLLAYTINYAAEVPPNPGLEYAVKGVFGGYRGAFSIAPYYLKVQEYRDIENRDIWEYRLNLTEAQLRLVLMHVWELGHATFDYFFFKENCAYHILGLLDVADPSWHLVDRFVVWTVPADTIRALLDQAGLVGEVVSRPARSTQIKRKRETLSGEERSWVRRLADDPAAARAAEFTRLAVDRQAFVLDLVSDYLRYRGATDEAAAERDKARNREILLARSALRVSSPPFAVEPFVRPPEDGHRTSRAGAGFGWRNGGLFEEVTIRAGYHGLLDPDPGYPRDAQLEVLALSLRHYQQDNKYRLEQLRLLDIVSLSPIDGLFRAPSWKVLADYETVHRPGCNYCGNVNVNGGAGAAAESALWRREVYFAFAELDANYGRAWTDNYRIGGGGTVGLLATLSDRWKVMASTGYLYYPLGDRSDDFRVFVGQRYTLAQNLAVRMEFTRRYDDRQVVFSIQAFF